MANKNFIVKNGLEVGGQEVVSSSGVVTSAALGGQTLASTDSPTFNNLTLTNDIAVGGDINLTGDLNITGDVNSLSVTDLDVTDKTITLGAGQVESASGGSGIVVGGSGASILWDETNTEFDINNPIHVAGGIIFGTSDSTLADNNIRFKSTGAAYIDHNTVGQDINFRISNASALDTTIMTLDAGVGSVGINTASPSSTYKLDVGGAVRSTGNAPSFNLREDDSSNQHWQLGSYGGVFALRNVTGGAYPLQSSGGQVGIGMAPSATVNFALDIQATSGGNALRLKGRSAGGNEGWLAWTDNADNVEAAMYATANNLIIATTTSYTERMRITDHGDISIGGDHGSFSGWRVLNLRGQSTGALYNFEASDGTRRAAIANSGSELRLQTFLSGGAITFEPGTGVEKMRIDSSGNVGIGTNNPSTMLHMNGTGDMIRLESTNSGAGGAQMDMLHFSASPADGDTQAAINMGGYYSGTSSAYFAAIRCVGTNVGGREGKLQFYTRDDSSWAQRFAITHTGVLEALMGVGSDNVALGNGALSSSSFNGDNVTAIGQNAGAAHTTGIRCTYVGNDAGDACTTGNDNTAIGQAALSTNVDGAYNTAVGRAALNASTSGYNTAVGYHALVNQSTGGQNTAIGAQTLDALETGSNNTAIGYEAAGKMTTGYDNVYAGRAAGLDSTTCQGNVVIGVEALENNTTGSEMVAIGKHAGRNASGGGSVYVGYQSGLNTTSGSVNVCVGQHTMYNSGTGFSNTCLGYSAGYHIGDGYRNVAIGHGCSIPSGQHHRYAIGYNNGGGSNTAYQALSVHNGSSAYVRITCGSSSVSSSSDERIKKDIEDCTVGLSFINRLRPVNYKLKLNSELPDPWQDDDVDDHDSGWHNGFIAQEVKAALDDENISAEKMEVWSEDLDNGGLQSLAEASLIPMLVKSIQELKAKNDALEARITELEG